MSLVRGQLVAFIVVFVFEPGHFPCLYGNCAKEEQNSVWRRISLTKPTPQYDVKHFVANFPASTSMILNILPRVKISARVLMKVYFV
jgi:hypothetical protein